MDTERGIARPTKFLETRFEVETCARCHAEIQAKYAGFAIVEKKASIGGVPVATGAFALGVVKGTPAEGPGKLVIYDVAGAKVGEAVAQWDTALAQPVPLQFTNGRLYVGRHWVEVK